MEYLYQYYKHYNKKYFDNKLPWPPRFETIKEETDYHGMVERYSDKDFKIIINHFYPKTENDLKEIILHEMVHIWCCLNNKIGHCYAFKLKLKEILYEEFDFDCYRLPLSFVYLV